MISVIVPVFNVAEYLPHCIRCLLDQDYPRAEYEMIFVDNGSTDGSLDLLRQQPEIQLLRESKRGSYAARNRGVQAARGDILAFLDPDCYPVPTWLRAVERSLSDPEVQICLGPRIPPDRENYIRLLAAYENAKTKLVCASDDPLVYYGHTNNMAVSRAAMDRCGLFVERMRGSDTIFVRRAVEEFSCRAVCYRDEVAVVHAELASLRVYLRKVMTYSRSRRAYGHIVRVRPLNRQERLRAFRQATRGRPVLESAQLFSQLALGAVAWGLGGINRVTTDR